jgi:hypothetical protein
MCHVNFILKRWSIILYVSCFSEIDLYPNENDGEASGDSTDSDSMIDEASGDSMTCKNFVLFSIVISPCYWIIFVGAQL